MKISEYITELSKILTEHGDLSCYRCEHDNDSGMDDWFEAQTPAVVNEEGSKHSLWHLPKRVVF